MCKDWNEKIKKRLRVKNPDAEWSRIIAKRIEKQWLCTNRLSSGEITRGAYLAHHGYLGSLKNVIVSLWDVNLSSVPADHLASLASCMAHCVDIRNLSGCDLSHILDSLQCQWGLGISRQSLSTEETQALVRVMETGVDSIGLGLGGDGDGDVILDIEALTKYSGQGKCSKIICYDNTATSYKDYLEIWAHSRNWQVTWDYYYDYNHEWSIIYKRN